MSKITPEVLPPELIAKISLLKFLVVDDMFPMRKMIGTQLKSLGVKQIVEASDGVAAWKILEDEIKKVEQALSKNETTQKQINLIISDWDMPQMTGIELLKKCRSNPYYQNIPFLLVTSESSAEQVKEAVNAKVDNYIVKPFTPQAFQEKLGAVVKKRFF